MTVHEGDVLEIANTSVFFFADTKYKMNERIQIKHLKVRTVSTKDL